MYRKYQNVWLVLIAFVWTVGNVGCTKKTKPQPKHRMAQKKKKVVVSKKVQTDTDWKRKGKAVAMKAFATLSSNLMKAMKTGGIPKAVPFCSAHAGTLTQHVAKGFKVKLARVSHKPRNPGNQASPSELKYIQRYAQQLKTGKALKPIIVRSKDKKVTFYAPITLAMPACLKCHGAPNKQIKKSHLALIRKLYPKDKATGFKLGEMRGMWKVVFSGQ